MIQMWNENLCKQSQSVVFIVRVIRQALLHIHKDKVDSTEGFNERVLKRWDATGHRKIGKLWNKEQENSE